MNVNVCTEWRHRNYAALKNNYIQSDNLEREKARLSKFLTV